MRILYCILIFAPIFLYAQNENGIKFENGLSWQEVIKKAQAKNKYIFMDCFATWCKPCKKMDNEVYSLKNIGEYMNDRFISVKVQMDTTKLDNEQVKKWYADANAIMKTFKINTYPTYLFFSPQGKIVHRDLGALSDSNFINLARDAQNQNTQFYTLLERYQRGEMNEKALREFAFIAKKIGDKNIGNMVSKEFKIKYLDKLSEEEICTKENLDFIRTFYQLANSSDPFFNLFYRDPDKADRLMFKNFSNGFVEYVIRREEIDDKLYSKDKVLTRRPDWEKIMLSISNKYNIRYANKLVPDAKMGFYKRINNWKEFARLRDKRIADQPPKSGKGIFESDGTWLLNSDAWDVFLHSKSKTVLKKALKWVELAIKLDQPTPSVQFLDTRANLLYKLGRVKEAIIQEQKAIQAGIESSKKVGRQKGEFFDEFTETINKMKRREPTW